MATGTGKTYTAFQIIWRLWKAKVKKRILFLVDRNALASQTKNNDFKPFGGAMTWVQKRTTDTSMEIYIALYQGISGKEDRQNIYKNFSPGFFDLIVIDECHRGSASEASAWRDILDYFGEATHLGMTATPKETKDVSNIAYFGEPIYTYTLKEGIEDGFLAPYKVVRIDLDRDVQGWRPDKDQVDDEGDLIEDRIYNQKDMDRALVLDQRTRLVAAKVSEFLKATNRYDKTIVFCEDIDHAERMRQAVVNENPDLASGDSKYVMRITGDSPEGKAELEPFCDPNERLPVVVTTSKLMTTGVDAKTCKLVVLDRVIKSMTEFKQIIGRGTRIHEDEGKYFFTIMDFKKATELFADPDFDGDPVVVFEPKEGESVIPPEDAEPPVPGEGETVVAGPGGEDEFGGFDGDDGVPDSRRGRRKKYRVGSVTVHVVAERIQYYGKDGKLVTEPVGTSRLCLLPHQSGSCPFALSRVCEGVRRVRPVLATAIRRGRRHRPTECERHDPEGARPAPPTPPRTEAHRRQGRSTHGPVRRTGGPAAAATGGVGPSQQGRPPRRGRGPRAQGDQVGLEAGLGQLRPAA